MAAAITRLAAAAMLCAMASALSAAGIAADMQHPARLAGEMFIAGATLVDPPPDEPNDTHVYFSLSGTAARQLYRSLKAAEILDACTPGRRMKTVGHVRCSVGAKPNDALCDFAIDLARGTVAPGSVC
jgi:hypothetical protein